MKKCLMLVLIFIYSFFFKVDGTAAWTDVYFNAEVSLSHYVNEDAHFLGIWNADKYRTGCDDFDNAPMKLSQDVALILVAYLIASETNETYGSVYQGMADTRLDVYRKNVKNPFEKSAITNAHNKLVEYYRNALKSGKKINLPEYYYIKRVDSNFFDVNDDRNVYYFDAFNLHMSKFAVRSLRIHMSDDSGVRKRIPWRITSQHETQKDIDSRQALYFTTRGNAFIENIGDEALFFDMTKEEARKIYNRIQEEVVAYNKKHAFDYQAEEVYKSTRRGTVELTVQVRNPTKSDIEKIKKRQLFVLLGFKILKVQNDGIDLSSSEQITGMSLASRIISSPTLEIFAAECIFDNNGRQTGYDFNNAIVFFSHKESDSHSYPKGSSDRSSGSLETRASAGDSDAQYQLAELYLEGKGVPQNDVKAAELFGKAAAQGNALAQFRFGWMFEDKRGVPQNYVKAAEWYEKAALQGVAVAQSNLAGMYFSGRGVPQNDKKAFAWYKKAAEQGISIAQYALALLYLNGRGVQQSDSKAAEWFEKAAEQGVADAQINLGLMYFNGKGVPQSDLKAAKWFERAAEQGLAVAQNNMGFLYLNGRGVPQNDKKAAEWYKKAAEQGYVDAQIRLGWLYENGKGVPRNLQIARDWYWRAAQQGDETAKKSLERIQGKW